MFYFRIHRLFVNDNKESKNVLGLFGKDLAELRLVSFIATEHSQLPDLSGFLDTTDEAKRSTILADAIEHVVSMRKISEMDNIKDNAEIPFGSTGYILYEQEQIPESFDWKLLVYESDKGMRDTAQQMQDIISHKEFGAFKKNILTLTKTAINPPLTAAIAISEFAVKVGVETAKRKKDDLVGILYTSLIRKEHYPKGIRETERVWDLTKNMQIDYSIYGTKNR